MNKLLIISLILSTLVAFVAAETETPENSVFLRGGRTLGACFIGQSGICGAVFGPIGAVAAAGLGYCGYRYAYRNRNKDETVEKIEAAGVPVEVQN